MSRGSRSFGDGLRQPRLAPDISHDAVVLIPGIMGSQLRDSSTGRLVWGLADLSWYMRAWFSRGGRGLDALKVTEEERAGNARRLVPDGLLTSPAFAPVLAGIEPYGDLMKSIRAAVVHPAAVSAFPYDWRLPVAHNAALLAEHIFRHRMSWLAHPAYQRARRSYPDRPEAGIVLVAHSMGGLLARGLSLIPGATDSVRTVITLGTPYRGTVKAAIMLNTGRGCAVPLRHDALRRLAPTLPGLHDLLPTTRCVDLGNDAVRLTPGDVRTLGGDKGLAGDAMAWHRQVAAAPTADLRLVVGVDQPTVQSMTLRTGLVLPRYYSFQALPDGGLARARDGQPMRVDRRGDGTVARDSAELDAACAVRFPQQHGPLARSGDILSHVRAVISGYAGTLGPALGGSGSVGMELPDVVVPAKPWPLRVTGAGHAIRVRYTVLDCATNRPVAHPELTRSDGGLQANVTLPEPGIFRVWVKSADSGPVSQLVMAIDTNALDEKGPAEMDSW